MLAIDVTVDDLDTVQDHGSVIAITGTAHPSGDRVTFAGDHRSMAGLLAIVADNLEVRAAVEPWQILGRG